MNAVSMGARYPSGKRRPKDQPLFAGANTMWRRNRDYRAELAAIGMSQELGSAAGRMFLFGAITENELAAATHYAFVVGRWERYMGLSKRHVSSPDYERGYGREDEVEKNAQSGTIKAYERRANKAKRAYERLETRIPFRLSRDLLDELCLADRELPRAQWKDAKTLLRQLVDEFALKAKAEGERLYKTPVAVARIAAAAIAGIAENLKDVTHFKLLDTPPPGERGLVGYRQAEDGTWLARGAVIKHDKMLPAEIDAALLKAALNRGWKEREP